MVVHGQRLKIMNNIKKYLKKRKKDLDGQIEGLAARRMRDLMLEEERNEVIALLKDIK